jgi:Ser/Thr protein kinase RdoA (MazF antagonist)
MRLFVTQGPRDHQIEYFRKLALDSLSRWEIEASQIELIKYRENAVFRVDTKDERRFALRVHRQGYHADAALSSELHWINALSEYGIEVPEIIPTINKDLYTLVHSKENSKPYQIDLFAWIDGTQLGSSEAGIPDATTATKNYFTVGEIAAQVHNQSASWQPPANFERHSWSVEGLVGPQPLWGCFWELETLTAAQRNLLHRARDCVYADLLYFGQGADRYSMIHADLTPENLMVGSDGVRLIDFDDAGFGWHLFELATALYFVHREPNYTSIRDALVAGYRQHRSLPDEHIALLPLFLTARSFTYLGWVNTRPETETARQMTPELIDMACSLADRYVSRNKP